MAEAPLGIPTDPACVAAARDVAALLEGLGHRSTGRGTDDLRRAGPRLHRPRRAGLADYDGVDWGRSSRTTASLQSRDRGVIALRLRAAAQTLERLSRRDVAPWGRDFDLL